LTEILEIFKALSDGNRYNLVSLLLKHDYCVGALARKLSISESAVSQHLKILRNAGIVKGDKRGYYTHYWVDRNLLNKAGIQIIELSKISPSEDGCHKHNPQNQACCRKEEDNNV